MAVQLRQAKDLVCDMVDVSSLLRIGIVISYCFINFTLARDILGGYVYEILFHMIVSPSFWLKLVGFLFIFCLLIWIISIWNRNSELKKFLIFSTVVLIFPLLLQLIEKMTTQDFELSFFIPTILFLFFVFLNWRTMLRVKKLQ